MAATGGATAKLAARRGTTPTAVFAGRLSRHLDGDLLAAGDLFKFHRKCVLQIGAAAAAARTRAAKDIAENIAENIAGVHPAEAAETALPGARAVTIDAGLAELVVGAALGAVAEHLVGFVDFLEALACVLVIRIAVGMIFHRHAPISLLYCGLVGVARHTQRFVIIAFAHSSNLDSIRRSGTNHTSATSK